MGLQSQLSDVSSESLPILFLCLIAASISTIRSFIVSLVTRQPATLGVPATDDALVRSKLAKISDQIGDSEGVSFQFSSTGGGGDEDCVVCRCGIVDGNHVTVLPCRHVFHRDCLRGWLRHLNFSCPLCRFQLVDPGRQCSLLGSSAGS